MTTLETLSTIIGTINKGQNQLHVISDITGLNSSWVTLRYIAERLKSTSSSSSIILVSWSQPLEFWKRECQRACGITIDQKKFKFLDGLDIILGNSTNKVMIISKLDKMIKDSIKSLPLESKILLILDSPDLLLNTNELSAQTIISFISATRHQIHSILINLRGDMLNQQIKHQQLLTSLLHQSNVSISLRMLSSGQAQDVSGIIMIQSSNPDCRHLTGKEFLYNIHSDLSINIWERGIERP